ncbi:MAG: hypothetical protein WBG55_15965 [Pseudoalteromonas rhizosphaerae]|uniref:hypothetical protein n=1 Tax=Pseudoalteromonas rhizosphaerae TaxID=2518973 RepID=UPI003C768417
MDESILEKIAGFICGNDEENPEYRSSSKITAFFQRAGLSQFVHDGSTRQWWVLERLKECNRDQLAGVLKRLASPREYAGDKEKTKSALVQLNEILYVEGFKIKLVGTEPKFEEITVDFSDVGEDDYELKPLPAPDFLALGLEFGVGEVLKNRWDESQRCVDAGAFLSATIVMGSMLEGLLLGAFQKNPAVVNRCPSAPQDHQTGKVKNFASWKLAEMIDVAHHVGWLGLDVKKFSHSLREFRNLIHPYEQMATRMSPDADTCGISWLVVQAAVNDLAKQLKNG